MSGVGFTLAITVSPPAALAARTDLTWYTQVRETGGTGSWKKQSYEGLGAGTVTLSTDIVSPDVSLDVQTAYQLGGGQRSDWSATTTVTAASSALAPVAPTAITASDLGVGAAFVQWRNPASTNFDHARIWRNAHGSPFAGATDVSGPLSGVVGGVQSFTDPSGAGGFDYWATAENASNIASAPEGPANVTVTAVPSGVAPAAPTLIATSNLTSGEAWIGWTNPTSPNFHHARVWRNTVSTFGTATDVSGAQAGTAGASQAFNNTPGTGSFYYWVTAENVSNVASTPDGPSHVTVT